MVTISSFFMLMRKSNAVYEKYCEKLMRQWNLNATALQVFLFFASNPEYNTARDLCRMRSLKTGIASVAIEQLTAAGLLERRTDPNDRRIQRLFLTEKSRKLAEDGGELQLKFINQIRSGLTEEEFDTYLRLTLKLKSTIEEMDRSLS